MQETERFFSGDACSNHVAVPIYPAAVSCLSQGHVTTVDYLTGHNHQSETRTCCLALCSAWQFLRVCRYLLPVALGKVHGLLADNSGLAEPDIDISSPARTPHAVRAAGATEL